MIKRFLDQLVDAISGDEPDDGAARERAIRKATAVLMVDVALADDEFGQSERDRVLNRARTHFDLSPEEATELVGGAEEAAKDLVSLHEFTQLLHSHLDADEKASIVAMLWEVAYADGRLDKYEDALVLKISDLLHVNRGRVMRLKDDAKKAASGSGSN